LAIKIPTGQIDAGHRADALAMLTRLVLDGFVVLPVAGEYFRAAANFVDQFRLGLGAGTRCTWPSARPMARHSARWTGKWPRPGWRLV